jgi:pyridoxine 5-phosphate synthase
MTKLSVNINKIATLRNTRTIDLPNLSRFAAIALDAGAHGITVHPRPDQRHVRSEDVGAIAQLLARYPGAEYNIEGNPFHGLVEHCAQVKPSQATLVPDAREAFTSNHGWNLVELGTAERKALTSSIDKLHGYGCRVSLFVDAIPDMMPLARELGADRIELYTEPYAAAAAAGNADASLASYRVAGEAARKVGLGVNAGHDLSLTNLARFLHVVGGIDEVSIGHALIADALELGLAESVRRYRAICVAGASG